MLLKCSSMEPGKGKGKLTRAATVMRMTMSTGPTMTSRVHRKVLRIPSKRHPGKALPGKIHTAARVSGKVAPPGKRLRPTPTHCDNSNDSGLGFDQHFADTPFGNIRQLPSTRLGQSSSTNDTTTVYASRLASGGKQITDLLYNASTSSTAISAITEPSTSALSSSSSTLKTDEIDGTAAVKRRKLENCKFEIDDACSNDAFAFKQKEQRQPKNDQKLPTASTTISSNGLKISPLPRSIARTAIRRTAIGSQINNAPNNNIGVYGAVTLQSQIGSISQNGKCQLQILAQPEQQHRARYQTEGSRGAVKDRSGNGFPIVKLSAYDKPTTLQIFIGTDVGRVAPHMFYQACKVSGKNSTPCNEKKVEGTILIEIDLKPETDMTATCDCVGILKERNVDVEHRFPDQTTGPRSKKKSTRCRMVFRTQITHDDGTIETLQVCSQQIICTQPPGVPEICKKSLVSCPAIGGLELFIIGKNFLKDTRVIFQARRTSLLTGDSFDILWEDSVLPDKEFLQQTHLVCTVPPYINPDIIEPATVQLFVTSSNKCSESHSFIYTPKGAFGHGALAMATTLASLQQQSHSSNSQDMCFGNDDSSSSSSTSSPGTNNGSANCPTLMIWTNQLNEPNKLDAGMMPPPATTLPLNIRRTSLTGMLSCSSTDQISPPILKSEIIDENSQSSMNGPDTLNHDSMDHFANDNSMDGSNSTPSQDQLQKMRMISPTPLELIMQKNAALTNAFSPSINQNGLLDMASTSPMNVVDLRVKQEEDIAAQIQELVHPTINDNNKLLSALQQNENNFLSRFDGAKMNDIKVQVDGVPMFGTNTNNGSTDVMLNNNLNAIGQRVVPALGTDQQMQQTIDQQQSVFTTHQGLMTEAGTANTLNHILSYPNHSQSISPNILSTSPTNNSPLSTDVMLNSQPVAAMNTSSNMLTVKTGNSSSLSPGQSESDIIMNPTISPTMMCNNGASDTNNLMQNPVAMGDNSMLSVTTQQPASDAILTNLMQPMSIKQSDVAVKNMILNAAADILSSEPNSITPETTMNALMSLNSTPLMTQDQSSQQPSQTQSNLHSSQTSSNIIMPSHHHFDSPATPSITNILTHSDSTSSVVVLAGNNQLIQNVVAAAAAQNVSDIIQNQIVPAEPMQMNNFPMQNMNPQIVNVHPTTTAASAAAANLSPAQQSFLSDIQQEISCVTTDSVVGSQAQSKLSSSDTILQAVSLIRSDLSSPKQQKLSEQITATTTVSMPNAQINGNAASVSVQPANATGAIPQDITTMSDHDLISYINPSCFDQV